MYCARSRDRCHALLRNSDVINRGDHHSKSQKFKVLRSRWKSVRVCFRVRPTRWRCLFCAKMTSSRCHAHLLTCYVKNKGAPIALKICTSIVSTSADVVAVLVFRNSDVITLPRPLAHMRHENSKCSDCAETRHRRSWDLSWLRNDKTFSKFKRLDTVLRMYSPATRNLLVIWNLPEMARLARNGQTFENLPDWARF